MSHTDKQLRDSTQVAYMHVLEKSRQDLIKKTGKNIPYSIRELILNAIPNKEEIIKRAISDGKLKEGEEISFELLLEYADTIEEWDKTINWYKSNSDYDTGVSVNSSDKILILQTCSMDPNYYEKYYRYNLVIMGKLI